MVPGYEGLYMVSNLGRVKSLRKNVIMVQRYDRYGYKRVGLRNKDGLKTFTIHRLVAMAFIPNPDNLPCVNHKDEDKTNNCVDNLEWCTVEYNNNYGSRPEQLSITKTNGKLSKIVQQYTLDGELYAEYPSLGEVERITGFSKANVSACCNGKPHHNTQYGYIWKFKEPQAS